jgi:hypothetical protein
VHDVEQASCAGCRFFGLAFPQDQEKRQLRGWGTCTRPGQGALPAAGVLASLGAAMLSDSRLARRENPFGLYRSEPEDGCEYFEETMVELGRG